jgi:hypothetical protein
MAEVALSAACLLSKTGTWPSSGSPCLSPALVSELATGARSGAPRLKADDPGKV